MKGKRIVWAWLSALGILLAFFLLGAFVPGLVGLTGTAPWLLRALLWALGVAAALLVFLYLRARAKAVPDVDPADEEVDAVVAAARNRLPRATKLRRAPVVLVLGTSGSAKTTTVVHSGLEPELLAGEVQSGDLIVPTEVANLWLAAGTVLAEAGGPVVQDSPRWGRLLRHLRPSRLAAVLAAGQQAPRVAVVCLGCDELVGPGAQEAIVAAAQALRARLTDAARQFGVRLPVYVVFTKADHLPYFTDYVRSFTKEEADAVLGTTLPLAATGDPGRHREEESARVSVAFEGMSRALSLRRLDVLLREAGEDVRAGAYEFPRALRKASALATRFLVELCRPPQTGSGPFVRGFYFTGVRPVVVRTEHEPATPQPVPGGSGVEATAVFDPRALLARGQQSPPSGAGHSASGVATSRPSTSESRRVPEWTFLRRILRDVVLADRVAMGMTGGGARVNLLRRVALGTVLAGIVLVAAAFVISFAGNRRIVAEGRAAVASVQGVDLAGLGLAPLEDLARLDTLRAIVTRLRDWNVNRTPLRYRWGFYRGDDVLEQLRRVYFHRFERMLWHGTRARLVATLSSLPDTTNAASDYTTTFEALRAYIITTDHPEYSTQEFMKPVLMRHWVGAREIGEERARLARLQFGFFASELPFGNPYDVQPEPALLARARSYLAMFGDSDRLYQALLNEASGQAEPVDFDEAVPGSEAVLRTGVVVPGAFTEPAWGFVRANVENVDRFFASDAWVLGEQTVSAADRARLAATLRQQYEQDYVQIWTDFLASAAVPAYRSAQDAARTLQRLSTNESPLLQLLAIVAQHTAVDTLVVGKAFQPVRAVIPADTVERYIHPSNEAYVLELGQLARTMDQVASAQGVAQQSALAQAQDEADRVSATVRKIAQGFVVEGGAREVGTPVQRLLEQPITRLRPLLARLPAAATNAKGASFCDAISPVLSKYPFDQSGSVEATVDEVNAAFMPDGSALATLIDGLQELLVQQGREYRARPGVPRPPTPAFLTMLNRAVRISEALYPSAATAPTAQFTVRPMPTELLPEIVVTIDGRNHTVTRASFVGKGFEWNAGDAREARISARVGDEPPRPLVTYHGTWSAFRLFGQADWTQVAAGVYRLSWNVSPGDTLTAELSFPGRTPVFSPDVIGGLGRCVRAVIR